MFEFHVMEACPHCGKSIQVEACFNEGMEPIKTDGECYECHKKFIIRPWEAYISVDLEEMSETTKKKRK